MRRRSEIGWILAIAVVAVTLGFFIGGGPSVIDGKTDVVSATVATRPEATTTTTTSTTTSGSPQQATPTSLPSAAPRPPNMVPVRVYNGSTRAGQAVRIGDRLKAAGYEVLAPGPSPKDTLPKSVIHFVEGFHAEAMALTSLLGLPASAAAPAPNPAIVAGAGSAALLVIVADDLVVPGA